MSPAIGLKQHVSGHRMALWAGLAVNVFYGLLSISRRQDVQSTYHMVNSSQRTVLKCSLLALQRVIVGQSEWVLQTAERLRNSGRWMYVCL